MTKRQREFLESFAKGKVTSVPVDRLRDAVSALLREYDQQKKDLAAVYASLNGG